LNILRKYLCDVWFENNILNRPAILGCLAHPFKIYELEDLYKINKICNFV
jgi:hypothetical protein